MAKFFGLFGIVEANLDIDDDEPYDLIDPDLSGEPVVFVVKPDGTYNGQPSFKTEVVEWLGGKQKAVPARKAAVVKPVVEEAEEAEAAPAPKRTFAPKTTTASARKTLR